MSCLFDIAKSYVSLNLEPQQVNQLDETNATITMKQRISAICNSWSKGRCYGCGWSVWPYMPVIERTTSSMFQAPSKNQCNEAPFSRTLTSLNASSAEHVVAVHLRVCLAKLAIHAQRAQPSKEKSCGSKNGKASQRRIHDKRISNKKQPTSGSAKEKKWLWALLLLQPQLVLVLNSLCALRAQSQFQSHQSTSVELSFNTCQKTSASWEALWCK